MKNFPCKEHFKNFTYFTSVKFKVRWFFILFFIYFYFFYYFILFKIFIFILFYFNFLWFNFIFYYLIASAQKDRVWLAYKAEICYGKWKREFSWNTEIQSRWSSHEYSIRHFNNVWKMDQQQSVPTSTMEQVLFPCSILIGECAVLSISLSVCFLILSHHLTRTFKNISPEYWPV